MQTPEPCLPPYPPRFTMKQVTMLVIAGMKQKPVLPLGVDTTGKTVSPLDLNVRRLVRDSVPDRQHREQLRIWAWCHEDQVGRGRPRLSFQEGSFREQCDEHGWVRDTALRNVDKALTMMVIAMNAPEAHDAAATSSAAQCA